MDETDEDKLKDQSDRGNVAQRFIVRVSVRLASARAGTTPDFQEHRDAASINVRLTNEFTAVVRRF